jgi:uncharacterized protein (DUF2336 family)
MRSPQVNAATQEFGARATENTPMSCSSTAQGVVSRSLIDELEAAVHETSQERRVEMLRNVTDLFLGGADKFDHQQIDVFDDVLTILIQRVENQALAELGKKLAPVDKAPRGIIQNLARHDEIAVARPVLAQSVQLSDRDLVEIAKTKSQNHLGAITERKRLAAAVTDILVERGDTDVVRKLSRNEGASFSGAGFRSLVRRAERDEYLAKNLRMRADIPPQLLRQLISKATDTVRARLLACAPPETEGAIHNVLATASSKIFQEATASRDYGRAEKLISKMVKNSEVNEAAILGFAKAGKYEEIVVSIAHLCSAPIKLIEQLMNQHRYDGLLIACRCAGLHWATFIAILGTRSPDRNISLVDVQRARSDFLKLTAATAMRALRFWLVRGAPDANVQIDSRVR